MDKEKEKFFLSQFKDVYSDFPEGIICDKGESPDFLITGKTVVGIEVTELHQSTLIANAPLKQQEAERRIIVNMAQEICENHDVVPLYVSVSFSDAPIRKNERKRLANQVADIIKSNTPKAGTYTWVENNWTEESIIAIEEIFISRYANPTKHHWYSDESGLVQENCIREIQNRLDEKNAKIHEYLEKCDECWLLIVGTGSSLSATLHPDFLTRQQVYSSKFARSIFFQLLTGKWFEIKNDNPPNHGCS